MKQWQWAFAQAFLTIIVSAVIGGIFWVSYTESNKPLSIFGPEIKPTKIPEDRLARQVYFLTDNAKGLIEAVGCSEELNKGWLNKEIGTFAFKKERDKKRYQEQLDDCTKKIYMYSFMLKNNIEGIRAGIGGAID